MHEGSSRISDISVEPIASTLPYRPASTRKTRRTRPGPRLRRRPADARSPPPKGTPLLRLQRGRAPRALPGDRRGVRRLSARAPLRAQGQLDARDRAAAARARQRGRRQLDLGDRGRAARRLRPGADRLHRRRQVAARARARRRARPEGDQRRIGGRARAHRSDRRAARTRRARGAPRQPRHRRQEPSAHFDRPQDQQVRRAARRCARAVRDAGAPPGAAGWSAMHVHIGSQITTLEPLRRAARGRRRLARRAAAAAASRSSTSTSAAASAFPTTAPTVPSAGEYVRALVDEVRRDRRCRSSSSRAASDRRPAGVLVARVVDVKPRTAASEFVVLDAGMTELMRPALYSAFHRIEPVSPRPAAGDRHYEIVGPVCESSDVVGRDRHAAAARRSATSWPSATPARTGGDGVELQSPSAAGRSAGRRRRVARHPPPPDGRRHAGARAVAIELAHALHSTRRHQPALYSQTMRCLDSDRVRRARPERQADAGRAAARPSEAGRPQGAAGVVSRLRHVDRRGDRARAAGRARVRPRRDAAALHRQPLRAESRTCSAGSRAG